MTEPAREKRIPERDAPSTPTRVVKGKYTVDMRPESTHSIRTTSAIFAHWLSTYPLRISALFGSIPTAFEGMEEEISEIKRLSQSPHFRHLDIDTETLD